MPRRPVMDLDALATWALAALAPARKKRARAKKPAGRSARSSGEPSFPRSIEEVAARFALDASERKLLALLYAIERSFEVAQAARALSSATALTIEAARHALGDRALDRKLGPSGRLLAHALVTIDEERGAASQLRLGLGLAARLDGETADLGAGVWRLSPASLPTWASELAQSPGAVALTKQELLPASAPAIVSIEQCGRRDALALALSLARADRPVRVLDAEVALARGASWPLLQAARREAELDGDALVVLAARSLGESWRALAAPPAETEKSPLLIVLADSGKARELYALGGLATKTVALPSIAPPVESPARDDGFEQIRQLAVRDAERALGIARSAPSPVAPPAPPAPPPPPKTAPTAAATPPTAPATAPPPPKTAPTASATPPTVAPTPPPIAAPTPPPIVAPAPPPIATSPPPVAAADEPPFVEVPADARPEVLARICASSPSPRQRIELIAELSGLRNGAVVAAIRSNTKSEHAGVRAAAETAMAKIFGPSWNVSRPVPKPVQPPRSDDEAP